MSPSSHDGSAASASRTCGVNALAAAVSSNQLERLLPGRLRLGPGLQRRVAPSWVGVVIDALDGAQRHPREHVLTYVRVGRQRGAARAAALHERAQIAAVVLPRVVAVVVGDRRAGVERLAEREVQLATVRLPPRVALADVVQEVPDRLVGDQQAQQPSISVRGRIQNSAAPSA